MKDNPNDQAIRYFTQQIRTQDIINVGFMKPMELQLRTNSVDKSVAPNSLPQGMMNAIKDGSVNDNKYKLVDITPVDKELRFDQVRAKHQDNYISLLKKPEGLELAICVCMYSEDKKMLKRTLLGIADNIDKLIDQGISPDDIFVCIVIDGIQKVDESLFHYFQEFQRQSQIFLEEDEQLTLRQKYANNQVHTEIDDQAQPLNYSRYLFDQEQYQNRIQRKFVNIREKYDDITRIKTQIQNIKKERNNSNQNLKMILNKIIDQQKEALKSMAEDDMGLQEMEITEESIMKELGNSEEECNQYIAARDNLAYICSYRLPTKSLSSSVAYKESLNATQRNQQEDSQARESLLNKSSITSSQLSSNMSNIADTTRRNKKYVNLFFCIKYKNSGKLSSHNWFFNGFCNELKPRYAILLDVGLRPYPEAIYKMYNYMKHNKQVGGVCGYMSLKAEKVEDDEMHKDQDLDWLSSIVTMVFDIQKAQQIEYHFAHLIDKPFESIFKFIHVLPGAFSGYSMDALRPVDKKDTLLRQYFKSIEEKLATNKVVSTIFTPSQILMRIFLPKFIWKIFQPVDPDSQEQVLYNENIYLAEDRILCMGIHKNQRDIIFMPDAFAEVDPIKTVNGLMGQRKRWINGSMFAFEKVQKQMAQSTSPKMAVADLFLKMQIFYLNMSNFLVYFAPALMLFTFHLTMQTLAEDYLSSLFSLTDTKSAGAVIYATFVQIMDFIYVMMYLSIIYYSIHLTHSNKKFIYYIYLFSTLFGLFALTTFVIFFVDVIKGFAGLDTYLKTQYQKKLNDALPGAGNLIDLLRYFIISSMGLYILPICLYGLFFLRLKYLWEILTGTASFLFYSPSYLNLLNVYAICRIDDISWGTKGLDAEVGGKNSKLKQTWKVVKMIDVAKFMVWNMILGVILITFDKYLLIKFFITLGLLILFTFILSIKMFIGVCYLIKYRFFVQKKNQADIKQDIADNGQILEKKEIAMHIFGIIDHFSDNIKEEIKMSFQSALLDIKEAEMMNNPQKEVDVNELVVDEKLKKDLKYIRKNNEIRKSFYPDQMARKSRMVMKNASKDQGDITSIEVHLLQRRVEIQTKKQGQTTDGRQASKRFDKIRQTFMNRMQSKRIQF